MKKDKPGAPRAEIDLQRVQAGSIRDRHSKVHLDDFARVVKSQEWFARLDEALPRILAGNDFRQVVNDILTAFRRQRPVILLLGAHVIKCGLSALIVDLMRRGVVSAVALNGAGAIHDVEIAMWGRTSEDVAAGLQDGSFGMTAETAELINSALAKAGQGEGFGTGLGRQLNGMDPPHGDHSLLVSGARLDIPVTVHVALGTDVIHQHPSTDGAIIGELSYRDFKILSEHISRIGDGGVVINVGSAVILPEVFLKCLSVARNLHGEIKGYTTVNMDMIKHYRPTMNIVQRPARTGGRGYQLFGHHEIMLPLLTAAVRNGMDEEGSQEEKTR
jgi:hypothetical protein